MPDVICESYLQLPVAEEADVAKFHRAVGFDALSHLQHFTVKRSVKGSPLATCDIARDFNRLLKIIFNLLKEKTIYLSIKNLLNMH